MTLLEAKVAIVTGASSGIGRAAAKLFASAGASVVVNARREELLDQLVAEIRAGGGQAVAVAGDVADEGTHHACVAAARKEFGSVDVAFNNAGHVGTMRPLVDITPQEWAGVLAVNLTSAFLGARAQVPAMLECGGGALIFTSSFVGNSVGLPGMAAYAAAKAGLMGLVRGPDRRLRVARHPCQRTASWRNSDGYGWRRGSTRMGRRTTCYEEDRPTG